MQQAGAYLIEVEFGGHLLRIWMSGYAPRKRGNWQHMQVAKRQYMGG